MTIDGNQIKAARRQRGWSQYRLVGALRACAAQQGIALMSADSLRGTLSRWENGHQKPDGLHCRLLRQVLEFPPTAVDLSENSSLFGVLQHHTNSLRLLDRQFGAPAARLQTAAHVSSLDAMWETRSGIDRIAIAQALSDAASLAAWQDLDVGDTDAAAKHYAQARTAAMRAQDPILLAHTIGEESVMLAETGRADQALIRLARAERSAGLPPLLRSWLSATRAQVMIYLPGLAQPARDALATAHALLPDRAGDSEEMPFIAHDETHLARWTGHILARLGDPAAAAITRESMSAIPEDFVRARCAQHLDLAEAAINASRGDEAESLLSDSAGNITALGSGRLMRRHDELRRRYEFLVAS